MRSCVSSISRLHVPLAAAVFLGTLAATVLLTRRLFRSRWPGIAVVRPALPPGELPPRESSAQRCVNVTRLPSSGVAVEAAAGDAPTVAMFRAVREGRFADAKLKRRWSDYQREVARKLAGAAPARTRFRVLVATYVPDALGSVRLWAENTRRLARNTAGDSVHFAFFHYDGANSFWRAERWYGHPRVVLRHVGPGCPPMFWYMLNASFASAYDYIWLCDGDIHLGWFSWDIYREVLARLRPLASQPAVVSSRPGGRSSELPPLRMSVLACGDGVALAREATRSEVMTPILSTRLWPAVLERLAGGDQHTAFFLDDLWDAAALANGAACRRAGIVVVDASPARHMDFRRLTSRQARRAKCTAGSWKGRFNNRPTKASTLELMARAADCPEARALLASYKHLRIKDVHYDQALTTSSDRRWTLGGLLGQP